MNLPIITALVLSLLSVLAATSDSARFCPEVAHLDSSRNVVTPPTWKKMGVPKDDSLLKFTVALRQQNLDVLENLFNEVSDPSHPNYGKHLSLAQLSELVLPKPSHMKAVIAWLKSEGVNDFQLPPTQDLLSFEAPVFKAQRMFNCTFAVFEHEESGKRLTRCTSLYSVPQDVAAAIDFVGGLIHFPKVRKSLFVNSHQKQPKISLAVTPDVIRKLYNVGDVKGLNSTNKQAVAQFLDQWYAQADLDEFFLEWYRPALGDKPTVIGQNKFPAGTEASLDIEYIMSVGAKVPTEFWSNDDSHENQEPFLEWLFAVSNCSSPPYVFSVSYGDDEYTISRSYADRCNIEFQKQGVRGISILFASGDSGVGGKYENGKCVQLDPNFPVSSPYVTGVGGTMLGALELGPEEVNGLSGGGLSNYFPMPDYQKAAVAHYFQNASDLPPSNLYNRTGRAYPDISALSSGFIIVVDLIPVPFVAGTSCAAPTYSGVISLLNDIRLQQGKSSLGFLNPLLYQWGANGTNVYNDISKGCNPGCNTLGFCAIEGFDLSSGWGSPNYARMAEAVLALP